VTPVEYGRMLARDLPPLSDWQVEEAARILAADIHERARKDAA